MPSSTQISPPQRRSPLSLVPPVSLLPCRRRGDAAPQVRTHLSDLSVPLSVRQPDLLSVCELQVTQAPRLSRALGSVLPLRTSVMTAQAQMNLSPPLCPPARHPLPSLRRNDTVSEQGENSMTGKSIQLPLSPVSHSSVSLLCVSPVSYLSVCSPRVPSVLFVLQRSVPPHVLSEASRFQSEIQQPTSRARHLLPALSRTSGHTAGRRLHSLT